MLDPGGYIDIDISCITMQTPKKIIEGYECNKNNNPVEIRKTLKTSDLVELVDSWNNKLIDIENMEKLFGIVSGPNCLNRSNDG